MLRLFKWIIWMGLLVVSISCKKEPTPPKNNSNNDTSNTTQAIYVLNEGLFNMNNASITLYNINNQQTSTDIFEIVNGRKIGDTGNDMKIYGNKMYVVVSVSSQIEVINPKDCKSIKQIPVFNGEKPRQPRYIDFYKNFAFVCCFDGTVAVIDTANLNIVKYINVGRNPDGIIVANDKLYVSNSGGLSNPNYDNSLSVIDLQTFQETKKITVGINPYTIAKDNYDDIYVISRGDYANVKMTLQVINTKTDEIKHIFNDFEALNITIAGDTAYIYYFDFISGGNSKIMTINVKTEQIISQNFITDKTNIETVYAIAIHPTSKDVYIADAKGFTSTGYIYCFDKYGKQKFNFKAGLNPSKIIFK